MILCMYYLYYFSSERFGEFGNHDGMDFMGFTESMQVLEVEGSNDEFNKVFCQVAHIKPTSIDSAYLTFDQFKVAWSKLCNVEKEMKKRNMKNDYSFLGQGRSRDKLLRYVTEKLGLYNQNLSTILGLIEGVKSERRHHKDQKKREHASVRDKLQHEANKFIG